MVVWEDEAGFGGNVGKYFGWWWAVAWYCREASWESLWGRRGGPLSEEGWAIACEERPAISRSCLRDKALPCLGVHELRRRRRRGPGLSGEIGAEGGVARSDLLGDGIPVARHYRKFVWGAKFSHAY